jgi:hypothetical protein
MEAIEQKRKEIREARTKLAQENREKRSGFSRLFGKKTEEEKEQDNNLKKQEKDLSFAELDEEDLKHVFWKLFFFFSFYFIFVLFLSP